MPKKTLERLTFEFLKRSDEADQAADVATWLPIQRNKMALVEAEDRFAVAREALRVALGSTPLANYIKGIQHVAAKALEPRKPKRL
jgi:hypothetical protein